MDSNDWRLNGQETYLKGKRFQYVSWFSGNPTWDHDHCEFCYAKISNKEGDINEAYEADDGKYWICPKCFEDFSCLLA